MKRTSITMRYSPNDQETFAVTIIVPNDYPDCLNQARGEAQRAIRDMSRDAIETYRATVAEASDE